MRNRKILTRILVGVVALLVLIPLLLSVINWNFAKPWISERVSEATGRAFAIHGDLVLSWRKPAQTEVGWRRLLPWPHLRAHDLELGNPLWATTGPTMAKVPQVDFVLNPLALLQKKVSVSGLILTEPDLVLELGKEGQNNWTFKKKDASQAPSPWQLDLRDLSLNEGTVRLVDPVRKADVTTRIDTLDDGSIVWKISGKLDKDTVSGDGKAGALLSLQERDTRYPVEAQLKVGNSTLVARGTLTNPRHISALDVQLKITGASMAHLFPFSGIVLPDTPRFSTEGRVVGSLARDNFHLRYEKFTGKVGNSDIGGTLEYLRKEPRPLLRGEVVSNHLSLKDLGALVGSDSAEEKKKRGDKTRQPPDKVLPVAQFRSERWDKIDAQVRFTGKKIIREESIPIDDLVTTVRLDNGALSLAPLNFGVAGGRFNAELDIDGKREPARARMQVTARGIQLNRLFPKAESMRASLGQIHVNAALSASGNSLAALAASANGEIKGFITEGTISKFILEAMGLNLGSLVVTQIFGDRQVRLNCLAGDFSVKDGLMQARTFVVDTEDAIIGVEGQINLARETLGLTILPESKGLRVISLRSPLHVRGTFKQPDVGVDKGIVAMKAGAATLLGTLATPLAALLALINPGPDQKSPCAQLLAMAKEKPVAPPAEATRTKQKKGVQ
ncbi:AsmA family protein [Janthinobacterium sp. 17J80-10]|nr:AsmA family protein [Janthinobacterium sp. 17J80-10]